MKKKIDLLGNEIEAGDVLIELGVGYDSLAGSNYKYLMQIYEYPNITDGRGYEYAIDGRKTPFYWVSVSNSIKIDMELMPKGFEYSFKHGLHSLNCTIKTGTPLELIENSNWKKNEVKKEDVERYQFMKTLSIECLDDIKENIHELRKGRFMPTKTMNRILEITKNDQDNPYSEHTAAAQAYDELTCKMIISLLSSELDFC